MNDYITLLQPTTDDVGGGAVTTTYKPEVYVFGRVQPLTAREALTPSGQRGANTHKITIRKPIINAGLTVTPTVKSRLQFDGRTFYVAGITIVNERGYFYKLDCREEV